MNPRPSPSMVALLYLLLLLGCVERAQDQTQNSPPPAEESDSVVVSGTTLFSTGRSRALMEDAGFTWFDVSANDRGSLEYIYVAPHARIEIRDDTGALVGIGSSDQNGRLEMRVEARPFYEIRARYCGGSYVQSVRRDEVSEMVLFTTSVRSANAETCPPP